MGTTVVAGLIRGRILSLAHVSDSRLYLVRGQNILPLTVDHSLVAEQVRLGLLTSQEAEGSTHRHILIRALGIQEQVDVALGEVSLMRRDCLVLCLDGLTQRVTLTDIVQAIRETEIPQAACERLVQLTNIAGGEDSLTAIVVSALDTGARWN